MMSSRVVFHDVRWNIAEFLDSISQLCHLKWHIGERKESLSPVSFVSHGDNAGRIEIIQIKNERLFIGWPTLGIAQPNPSNRIDYDVLIRFSSSYVLSIHVNTSLQSLRPL
jgi:hypothetical protein